MKKPPIITGANENSIAQLIAYLSQNKQDPAGHIAEDEARRLTPYFAALDARLDTPQDEPNAVITHHKIQSAPENISGKGGLARLFSKVAADTGNVITSEFAIIPSSLMYVPAIRTLEQTGGIKSFFKSTAHNDTLITLGFIQCLHDDGASSVTVPVAALDRDVLALVKKHDTKKMLDCLQAILTAVNHDMMHHLTNVVLNSDVSKITQGPPYAEKLKKFISTHVRGRDESPGSYESWALLSHADTWRKIRGSDMDRDLNQTVEAFFESLRQLDRDMKDSGESPERRATAIDYFAAFGAFGLMRIHTFDTPVMQRALDLIEEISPVPENVFVNYTKKSSHQFSIVKNPALRERLQEVFYELIDDPVPFVLANCNHLISIIRDHNDAAAHWDGQQIDVYALQDFFDNGKGALDIAEITTSLQMLKKILQQDFDTLPVSAEDVPAKPRVNPRFVQETMRQLSIKTAVTALHHISANPEQSRKYDTLIRDCCHSHVETLRNAVRDQQNYLLEMDLPRPDLLIKTLANYSADNHALIGQKGDDVTFRMLKLLEIIRLAPEIAYLASPAADNMELIDLRWNAREIDRGIRDILQEKPG